MIRIVHLYPELLNLYGEYANIAILTRYLTEEGAEVEVTTVSLGETIPESFDLLYMGCGTERASIRALTEMKGYRDVILNARRNGSLILATGNSFELFGREITDDRGGVCEGLGMFDYTVNRSLQKRFLGDAVLTSEALDRKVIGFINKCSSIHGVKTPWFHVEMGLGNDNVIPSEGCLSESFMGTSLIGPLLVRNPVICRYLMDRLYDRVSFIPTEKADMSLQERAYEVSLRELSARMEKTS